MPFLSQWRNGRVDVSLILPVELPVTIGTMLNFERECDSDRDDVGMCKDLKKWKKVTQRNSLWPHRGLFVKKLQALEITTPRFGGLAFGV